MLLVLQRERPGCAMLLQGAELLDLPRDRCCHGVDEPMRVDEGLCTVVYERLLP